MGYSLRSAYAVARELLVLTRDGQADRLASALVTAASPTPRPLLLRDVVTRLTETFARAIRDRRAALHVGEPYRLLLCDPAGYPVQQADVAPRVRTLACAIAAEVRGDHATRKRLVEQACDTGAIQERISVLAQCVVWTNDVLSADPGVYPPRLQCLRAPVCRTA